METLSSTSISSTTHLSQFTHHPPPLPSRWGRRCSWWKHEARGTFPYIFIHSSIKPIAISPEGMLVHLDSKTKMLWTVAGLGMQTSHFVEWQYSIWFWYFPNTNSTWTFAPLPSSKFQAHHMHYVTPVHDGRAAHVSHKRVHSHCPSVHIWPPSLQQKEPWYKYTRTNTHT